MAGIISHVKKLSIFLSRIRLYRQFYDFAVKIELNCSILRSWHVLWKLHLNHIFIFHAYIHYSKVAVTLTSKWTSMTNSLIFSLCFLAMAWLVNSATKDTMQKGEIFFHQFCNHVIAHVIRSKSKLRSVCHHYNLVEEACLW